MKDDKEGYIIYRILDSIIKFFYYLSLVEAVKSIFRYNYTEKSERIRRSRLAIDIFIISKWIFILIILFFNSNLILIIIVIYLIIFNIHSYLYYHFWNEKSVMIKTDYTRIKNRFIAFIQALLFNIVGFAYLYSKVFSYHFQWSSSINKVISAISFSFTNTLLGSSDIVAISNFGVILQLTQYLISIILVSIILSMSFNFNYKK